MCLVLETPSASDRFTSTLFLTLLFCLQCSDNDFRGGDVSKNALYLPGCSADFLRVVFLIKTIVRIN